MLPTLFLMACSATPAAESVRISLGAPTWTAQSGPISASVRSWHHEGERGRLVLARVPAASASVLTTNTPTPLQELLPAGDLVAINFDRARGGLMNEFAWSQELSRSIGVDVRLMLWLVGTFDGASDLVAEMTAESKS